MDNGKDSMISPLSTKPLMTGSEKPTSLFQNSPKNQFRVSSQKKLKKVPNIFATKTMKEKEKNDHLIPRGSLIQIRPNFTNEISAFKRTRRSIVLQAQKSSALESSLRNHNESSIKGIRDSISTPKTPFSFAPKYTNTATVSKISSSLLLNKKKTRRSSIATKNRRENEPNITPEQFNRMISDSSASSVTGKIKRQIKFVDILLAIIVSANIVLALAENEIYYDETEKYLDQIIYMDSDGIITRETYRALEKRDITTKENTIRYINLIVVICLLIGNFIHYYLTLKRKKKEGILSEHDGFCSSGLFKYYMFENFILIWTNPPYLNYFLTGTTESYDFAFSLGSLICIISIFKCYLIVRVYTYFSKWTTDTAVSLCNNACVNPGVHFAFKSELKYRPFSMLIIIFVSVVIAFGFVLRTFEYFAIESGTEYSSLKGNGNDQDYLKDFVNSIWNTIVTMTTVGYGDFVPNENFGRFLNIISCITGLLLVSVIVVSLAIISEFSEDEKKAYSIVKKLNADKNVILKSAEVISALSILRMRTKNKNCKLSERFVYIMKLKQSISAFKDDYKIASSMALPLDQTFQIIRQEIAQHYETLGDNILELRNISNYTKKIQESQKNCIKTMNEINRRQVKLGQYLVKLNNTRLMKTISTFESLQSNSK